MPTESATGRKEALLVVPVPCITSVEERADREGRDHRSDLRFRVSREETSGRGHRGRLTPKHE